MPRVRCCGATSPPNWLARLPLLPYPPAVICCVSWSPASGASGRRSAGLPAARYHSVDGEASASIWPRAFCSLGRIRRLTIRWPVARTASDQAFAALRRLAAGAGHCRCYPRPSRSERRLCPRSISFLAKLHRRLRATTDGLDQAWQGKGRGTLVRLIGCLALLDWSVVAASRRARSCRTAEAVEQRHRPLDGLPATACARRPAARDAG